MVTVAAGITAWVLSVTTPEIEPVEVCACDAPAKISRASAQIVLRKLTIVGPEWI